MKAAVFILVAAVIVMVPVTALPAQAAAPQCGVASAVLGTGPASQLASPSGPSFDTAYIRSMYQQHADIAGLSALAATRATDSEIRDLADHIRGEQVDLNRKLALWHSRSAGEQTPPVSNSRYEGIVAGLNCSGMAFDAAWAQAMISLLQQSRMASDLAQSRSGNSELKHQAGIVSRAATNETRALQQWLRTGYTGRGTSGYYDPYFYGSYGRGYYGPYYRGYYGPYYGSSFGWHRSPYRRGSGISLGFGFFGF